MVAVSARMLAELAVADGYEVTALDRFGDVDLRAIAPGSDGARATTRWRRSPTASRPTRSCTAPGSRTAPTWCSGWPTGGELLGTPPELLAAVRDPWAVAGAARAAGARAPETRRAADLPEGGRPGGLAAQAAARRRRAWRPTLDGRRLRADRDPPAPCRRALLLGGGDRRRAASRRARGHRAAASPAELSVDRQRGAAATARRRAGRARRPAASRLRRGRRALRRARRVRGRRGLGWPSRLGGRGQPASAGCARAVRPWHFRGACAGRSRSGVCPSRHAAGDEVCEGEARAVRRPRPPRAGPRMVAVRAGSRHPARRRGDQARRTRVHADLGDRRRARTRRARRPPAGRAARRWSSPVPEAGRRHLRRVWPAVR